jgi:hypothetical protein
LIKLARNVGFALCDHQRGSPTQLLIEKVHQLWLKSKTEFLYDFQRPTSTTFLDTAAALTKGASQQCIQVFP